MANRRNLNFVYLLFITMTLVLGVVADDDCCEVGDTKPDENDCTQYYGCCTGKFVLKSCPSGQYWNRNTKQCEDDNGQCVTVAPCTCTDGDLKADDSDCTKYLVCKKGQYVSASCNSGDYWNSASKQCEKDNGQCVTQSPCTNGDTQADASDCTKYLVCKNGQYVSASCNSGDYWNSASKQCEKDNGQCVTQSPCTNGDTQADASDCTKYLVCKNGQYVSASCNSGDYWNSASKQCEKDNGQCVTQSPCTNGDTQADASDCTKYLVCKNGQYVSASCNSGDYWNSASKQCEKDNGQCVTQSPCTNGDTQADASDCTKYLVCKNGQYVSASCNSGDYWNSASKQCEKDNGQCVTQSPCTNGDTQADASDCTKYLVCKNGQYVSASCNSGDYWNSASKQCEKDNGQCVTQSPCTNGDTQADASDCTKYLVCKNGQYVSASCNSGDYWNSASKQCEKDNGQCVTQSPCTNGDTQADASDCTKYLVCKNGQYVSASCNSGDYWNSASKQCEKDNGQCVSVTCKDGVLKPDESNCAGFYECVDNKFVQRKCPAQTYFDNSLGACVIDENGVCIPKVCDPECCDMPNNWIGPVDKNCSAFIQCLYGNVIQQNCPNNLQFNNITKECDYPDVVQCDDGSLPPSGPTAGPSGTYCESKGRCLGKRDGTMLVDDKNKCSGGYIVCQCECEVAFTCSAGLAFNQQVLACDWPENSGC